MKISYWPVSGWSLSAKAAKQAFSRAALAGIWPLGHLWRQACGFPLPRRFGLTPRGCFLDFGLVALAGFSLM